MNSGSHPRNRVSPRRPFSNQKRGPLHLDESAFELSVPNVSLAVFREMPSQRVLPPAEDTPTHETFGSFTNDPDVPLALPPPTEAFVAHVAAPLPSDVVEHGSGQAAP